MRYFVVSALLSALLIYPSATHAQTAEAPTGAVGCFTVETFEEFLVAISNSDRQQIRTLLDTSCLNMAGREYSVAGPEVTGAGGMPLHQVRVYAGGGSVLLWTINDAALN